MAKKYSLKDIRNLILQAVKNPDKDYYKKFDALEFLSCCKDYDWSYECSKTDKVRKFIETCIKDKNSVKEVKRYLKKEGMAILEKYCFYEEFCHCAHCITMEYKTGFYGC